MIPDTLLQSLHRQANDFAKSKIDAEMQKINKALDEKERDELIKKVKQEIGRILATAYAKGYADSYDVFQKEKNNYVRSLMKGALVFSTLLFIFGFVALVTSVFIILNKENTGVKIAEEQITKVLLDLATLNKELEGIKKMNEIANKVNREEYEKIVAANLKQNVENEKLYQKINWLEIKMSAIPKNTTQTLILKQEEPLKVKMLYKKVPEKKAQSKPIALPEHLQKDLRKLKELNEIKKKMDEINK